MLQCYRYSLAPSLVQEDRLALDYIFVGSRYSSIRKQNGGSKRYSNFCEVTCYDSTRTLREWISSMIRISVSVSRFVRGGHKRLRDNTFFFLVESGITLVITFRVQQQNV